MEQGPERGQGQDRATEMTAGQAFAVVVTLVIALVGIAVSVYAGLRGWSLLSLPLIALPLALNRANGLAIAGRRAGRGAMSFMVAFAVSFPVFVLFCALLYGVGYAVGGVVGP